MPSIAATPVRQPDAVIDQKAIFLQPNTKEHKPVETAKGEYRLDYKPRSAYERILSLVESAYGGPFRFGQLGDRSFALANVIHPNEGLKNVSTMFKKGWTITIIPRLFGVTKEAKDAVATAAKPSTDSEGARRKYVIASHHVFDAAAAWGYATSLFLACIKKTANASLSVLKAADTVTFVADVADAQMQIEDFSKARSLKEKAQQLNAREEVQKNLGDTQRFHFLKTMKAICSIAGFILGLGLIATGAGALLGFAVMAASLSLAGTIFAMSASLHEEGMKYERVKFFDDKHVQRLPSVVAA